MVRTGRVKMVAEHPFDINDGESYFVIYHNHKTAPTQSSVLANGISVDRSLPWFPNDFRDAMMFETKDRVEEYMATLNLTTYNNEWFEVKQVKDLFIPKYYIKWEDMFEPRIDLNYSWYLINDTEDKYTDLESAQAKLDKLKCNLVNYHQNKIMKVKSIKIW